MTEFEEACLAVAIVATVMFVGLFWMFYWEVCHRAGGACN